MKLGKSSLFVLAAVATLAAGFLTLRRPLPVAKAAPASGPTVSITNSGGITFKVSGLPGGSSIPLVFVFSGGFNIPAPTDSKLVTFSNTGSTLMGLRIGLSGPFEASPNQEIVLMVPGAALAQGSLNLLNLEAANGSAVISIQ